MKEAQKLLEKHDPQYQQWKKEAKKERTVELQEQAEALAKVMKEQFDQTMGALSPSLMTPPQFPPCPSGVPNLPLVAEEAKMICWGRLNFEGLNRNCCTFWSEWGDQG